MKSLELTTMPCGDFEGRSVSRVLLSWGRFSNNSFPVTLQMREVPSDGTEVAKGEYCSIKVGWVRYDTSTIPSQLLLSLLMHPMATSAQNKVANAKVLERATLKIDIYLIPIVAMFCVSFLPLVSPSTAERQVLVDARLPYRYLVIFGERTAAAPLEASSMIKR